jgi:hypothetical protein
MRNQLNQFSFEVSVAAVILAYFGRSLLSKEGLLCCSTTQRGLGKIKTVKKCMSPVKFVNKGDTSL